MRLVLRRSAVAPERSGPVLPRVVDALALEERAGERDAVVPRGLIAHVLLARSNHSFAASSCPSARCADAIAAITSGVVSVSFFIHCELSSNIFAASRASACRPARVRIVTTSAMPAMRWR